MKYKLFTFLLVVFAIYSSRSQNKSYNLNDSVVSNNNEISYVNNDMISTFENAKKLRELFINPLVQNIELISIGDTIILDLFKNKKYIAYIDKIDVDVNSTLTIRARLIDFNYGYCIISTYNGKSFMTIEVPENDELYMSKYNQQNDKYYLFEIDKTKQIALEGAPSLISSDDNQQYNDIKNLIKQDSLNLEPIHTTKNIRENILNDSIIQNDENNQDTVTLMIVYTPAAATWASTNETDINNTISQLMAKAQLALDNSNTLLTIQLVHSEQVSYTELNTSDDLFNLKNTNDGFMDNVHSLRDTYCADLVVLLENINFTGGLGWLLNNISGSPSYAFSLTRVQQASWTYTTIHEIGHNMGCGHHKLQNVQPGPGLYSYSAGWRWTGANNGKYCSVMSYSSGNYFSDGITHTQVAYFSNPNILYQGMATGNALDGDNARNLRQIKSVVAGYRVGCTCVPPTLNTITPQTVCSGGSTTSVTLASTPIGSSFAWTSSATVGISGNTLSGTGNIPIQTLSTNTTSAGTVTYTITPTLNTCTGAAGTFVVTVYPRPIVVNQTTSIAAGANFTLIPSGVPVGTTYTWTAPTYINGVTGGDAQPTPQSIIYGTLTIPVGSGTATYIITPSAGSCVGTTFTGTVNVTSSNVPVNIVSQPEDNSTCAPSGNAVFTLVSSGTPPFTYQWEYYNGVIWASVENDIPTGASYINANTATMGVSGITTTGSSQYRCYVTNCNGVSNAISNAAKLTVNTTPSTPIITLIGNTLHSDAINGNQWYNQNGLINLAINQDYTITTNDEYYVVVTLLGCSSLPSNSINAVITGIELIDIYKTIKVYPNPVFNELLIEIEGNSKNLSFEILNSLGQVVFKGNLLEKTVVQTGSYSPGVYLLKLDNGKAIDFKKFIKE